MAVRVLAIDRSYRLDAWSVLEIQASVSQAQVAARQVGLWSRGFATGATTDVRIT